MHRVASCEREKRVHVTKKIDLDSILVTCTKNVSDIMYCVGCLKNTATVAYKAAERGRAKVDVLAQYKIKVIDIIG
jgi:hypothetical protein